ncbi:MAG: DNA polymerase III subunit gamma/tau [Oscillospiraceae bacterium]|nr:DNA polymerase III subunit gamma/tau [Oscillospiraceae bacterium]
MYKVFYRKWRPKLFDDVVGQLHVTDTLKNEVKLDHVAHAYMFCGTRGTGKTTCAKILAKAVNCLSPKEGNPCLECEICRGIESGSILDVSEIDAASNNGVENVRSIREEANFAASIARFRVYIIDEFHMLSPGAFNALLKILEDPPDNVIFILATTEFHKIPKTVVSRCQRFNFRRVGVKEITLCLSNVCNKENINSKPDVLSLIAKISDGSVRDALSILDQCTENSDVVDIEHVNFIIGFTDAKIIESLVLDLISGGFTSAILQIDKIYKDGKDMVRLCEELLFLFHDAMIFKTAKFFSENCIYNEESIKNIAEKLNLDNIIACFDILKECFVQMSKFSDKKSEVEFAIIKMYNCIIKGKSLDFDSKNQKKVSDVENFESIIKETRKQREKNCADSKVEANVAGNLGAEPKSKCVVKEGINERLISNQKEGIISEIQGIVPRYVYEILTKANIKLEEDKFFIQVSGDFALDMIKKNDYLQEIQKAVFKVLKKKLKIILEVNKNGDFKEDFLKKFEQESRNFGINTVIV